MKHMKHWLITMAVLLCSMTVNAESVEIDGIWYNLVNKAKVAEVTKSEGTEYSGSITIPATVIYEGIEYSVTSIGNSAFSNYFGSLTSITIPEGVTSIGSDAFSYCRSLTSITIPESMTSIGSGAFSYCHSLISINIPEGVTSVEESTFSGCRSLTSIIIPKGVTSIGDFAFTYCHSLTSINIPEDVTNIGFRVFDGCSSLTSITIPEGVMDIGSYAFRDCSNLTSINIPESVMSIGSEAFYGCSSLTSIAFPKSVKSIGSKAFSGCSVLSDVYCYAESVPSTETNAFDGSYVEYATLHVSAAFMGTYKNAAPWSSFGTIASLAEEKVTSITLSKTTATLTEGNELTLTTTVVPDYATDKSVTWTSSDESVATVDGDGKVTAVVPGKVTITATANDGSGMSASCEVTVEARRISVVITDPHTEDGFIQEEDEEFDEITYTRTFTGNWEALYVPFEIPVDEAFLTNFEVAYINDVRSYDTDNDGEVDDMVMEAFRIPSGTLRAGYPYLVRAKSAGEATITVTDATLYATTEENMHSVNCSSVYMEYTVAGTYETMTAAELSGCYAISKNGEWTLASSPSATLRPFRLYLTLTSRDDSYVKVNPAAMKAIRLRVDGEETTSIDNEQLTIDNSAPIVVYDLQGRRVENPGKGVYIVNGKKVVIK